MVAADPTSPSLTMARVAISTVVRTDDRKRIEDSGFSTGAERQKGVLMACGLPNRAG